MAESPFTIGARKKKCVGDIVIIHAYMADGRHVTGVNVCVVGESTFADWVRSMRDLVGRDPYSWEIESAQRDPTFFYLVTADSYHYILWC